MGPTSSVLSALPAFEAVARSGSFSAAGRDLGVTQSAVSHRIKQLEAELGFALFQRTTRRLALTPEGAHLARAAGDALEGLARALAELRREREGGQVALSVLSSFAVTWLVSHLGAFHAEQPDIRVSILAQDDPADLQNGQVDAAVRYAKRPTPGLHATRLGGDWLIPVAHRRLFADGRPPKSPQALSGFTLLADSVGETDGTDYSWSAWFGALGLDPTPFKERTSFNRADMAIRAALAGQGIALGRVMLLEDDLRDGSPLIAVGPPVKAAAGYYFVTLAERAAWPKVARFRCWIADEMERSRRNMIAHLGLP